MRIGRWSRKKLLGSWVLYWVGLLGVLAVKPFWQYLQFRRAGESGSVSAGYSGSALSLALWIAGPPLLLFLAWLAFGSRKETAGASPKGREAVGPADELQPSPRPAREKLEVPDA